LHIDFAFKSTEKIIMSVIPSVHHQPQSLHERTLHQQEDFSRYRHVLRTRVRSYDVDRQSIVHNAVYLYWLEAARIEYFRALGLPMDFQTFVSKHRFVVAHIDIDYIYAALFDQEYELFTRISWMKNSSLCFEQIARLTDDGTILVKANTVMVHLNTASHQPERIQDSYRSLVRDYEGENVQHIS